MAKNYSIKLFDTHSEYEEYSKDSSTKEFLTYRGSYITTRSSDDDVTYEGVHYYAYKDDTWNTLFFFKTEFTTEGIYNKQLAYANNDESIVPYVGVDCRFKDNMLILLFGDERLSLTRNSDDDLTYQGEQYYAYEDSWNNKRLFKTEFTTDGYYEKQMAYDYVYQNDTPKYVGKECWFNIFVDNGVITYRTYYKYFWNSTYDVEYEGKHYYYYETYLTESSKDYMFLEDRYITDGSYNTRGYFFHMDGEDVVLDGTGCGILKVENGQIVGVCETYEFTRKESNDMDYNGVHYYGYSMANSNDDVYTTTLINENKTYENIMFYYMYDADELHGYDSGDVYANLPTEENGYVEPHISYCLQEKCSQYNKDKRIKIVIHESRTAGGKIYNSSQVLLTKVKKGKTSYLNEIPEDGKIYINAILIYVDGKEVWTEDTSIFEIDGEPYFVFNISAKPVIIAIAQE